MAQHISYLIEHLILEFYRYMKTGRGSLRYADIAQLNRKSALKPYQ